MLVPTTNGLLQPPQSPLLVPTIHSFLEATRKPGSFQGMRRSTRYSPSPIGRERGSFWGIFDSYTYCSLKRVLVKLIDASKRKSTRKSTPIQRKGVLLLKMGGWLTGGGNRSARRLWTETWESRASNILRRRFFCISHSLLNETFVFPSSFCPPPLFLPVLSRFFSHRTHTRSTCSPAIDILCHRAKNGDDGFSPYSRSTNTVSRFVKILHSLLFPANCRTAASLSLASRCTPCTGKRQHRVRARNKKQKTKTNGLED